MQQYRTCGRPSSEWRRAARDPASAQRTAGSCRNHTPHKKRLRAWRPNSRHDRNLIQLRNSKLWVVDLHLKRLALGWKTFAPHAAAAPQAPLRALRLRPRLPTSKKIRNLSCMPRSGDSISKLQNSYASRQGCVVCVHMFPWGVVILVKSRASQKHTPSNTKPLRRARGATPIQTRSRSMHPSRGTPLPTCPFR